MSISHPLHPSPSQRNRDSRNYFTNSQINSAEALTSPLRELAIEPPSINDRLIVGVDFGTTFSG